MKVKKLFISNLKRVLQPILVTWGKYLLAVVIETLVDLFYLIFFGCPQEYIQLCYFASPLVPVATLPLLFFWLMSLYCSCSLWCSPILIRTASLPLNFVLFYLITRVVNKLCQIEFGFIWGLAYIAEHMFKFGSSF